MSPQRPKARRAVTGGRLLLSGVAIAAVAGACGSSSHQAVPKPTTSISTTVPAPTTSTTTTLPELQSSGPRTVLSPVGLNVRAQPSTSAKILGTASEGAVFTVLSRSSLGWFKVKGATVTGWITDSATLSAPGKFSTYASSANLFNVLFPVGWTVGSSPPTTVVFKAPASSDTVTVTPEATLALLPKVTAGYHQTKTQQVVACGVTSQLVTYASSTPSASAAPVHGVASTPYLAQVNLSLDAKHALGINGHITTLSQLQTVLNFVNSVTFPVPVCQP
jgi:uncharacterized protein YgiM (DUF1202 family)